jgi:adenylate cyclase
MAKDRVERKLKATLAADVAGYSRLMSEDEPGTLATLQAYLSGLIDPAIGRHDGRIVKLSALALNG